MQAAKEGVISRKQAWPLGVYKASIERESGQVVNWRDAATMGHCGGDQRGSGPLCAARHGWAFSECSSGSRRCYSRYIISFIFSSVIFFTLSYLLHLPIYFPDGSVGKETQEMQVQPLGQEELLEKKMAPHSSILAWKIPWTEEPGGLQSMGSQRGGHD